jgi:dihydrofolate synthase/folylpolyglutamate synthase
MRFGLDRMRRVLDALKHPEEEYRSLHVAGTNGKGSTCAFAASILRYAGKRVGLYTSPHLSRVNERIRVDGEAISDRALADGVAAIVSAVPDALRSEDPLTYFELGTAVALHHFAQRGVEYAVLETGLGGRLDATNVVPARVTAVTRIALDHTAILGDTLSEIAAEKAGIFKAQAKVVLARQDPEALDVLTARAGAAGQRPFVAGRDFALQGDGPLRFVDGTRIVEGIDLALAGPHQRSNAEVSVKAAELLLGGVSEESIRKGLRDARWPGRLETLEVAPRTVLDGAHNPDGARSLAVALTALYPGARIRLVFGALADKDVRGIALPLMPLSERVYLATPGNPRALALSGLEEVARGIGVVPEGFASIGDAVEKARRDALRDGETGLVVVAGSLYVVAEAREHILSARGARCEW